MCIPDWSGTVPRGAPPEFEEMLEYAEELQCVLRFRGRSRPIVRLPWLEGLHEEQFWLVTSALLAGDGVQVCSPCYAHAHSGACDCEAALHISLKLPSAFFSGLLGFAPPTVGLSFDREQFWPSPDPSLAPLPFPT